ncbi:hypothetical protein DPEC_G00045700, partial [Dallia pectoralis]
MQRLVPCVLLRGVNTAYIIFRPLAGFNTFFNLALYTLAGDKFQQVLHDLLRWRHKFLKTKRSVMVKVVSQQTTRRKYYTIHHIMFGCFIYFLSKTYYTI